MKIYAIVATTADAPDRPRLHAAFGADMVDDNPAGEAAVRSGLAEALNDPDILAARIVAAELDDDALMAELRRVPPTIGGVVAG